MPRRDETPAFPRYSADLELLAQLCEQAQAGMAAAFEVWSDCSRKSCRRSRRCTGPSVGTCLSAWSRRHIDDDDRAILHAAVKAGAAGASFEEACAAAERMAERIEAVHAAQAQGGD